MSLSLQAFIAPYPPNPHIPHLPNNPNGSLFCYLSPLSLAELNSQALSPVRLETSPNISLLALAVEIPEEIPQKSKNLASPNDKIFLSPETFSYLKLLKGQRVIVNALNGVLPMRSYEINSNFNYFPNVPVAKRVHLINVMIFHWFSLFIEVFRCSYAIETRL